MIPGRQVCKCSFFKLLHSLKGLMLTMIAVRICNRYERRKCYALCVVQILVIMTAAYISAGSLNERSNIHQEQLPQQQQQQQLEKQSRYLLSNTVPMIVTAFVPSAICSGMVRGPRHEDYTNHRSATMTSTATNVKWNNPHGMRIQTLPNQILSRKIEYSTTLILSSAKNDNPTNDENMNNYKPDDDNESPRVHPSGNPYADPNYPDLEFVNYDDPEYQIDYGIMDDDNEKATNRSPSETEQLIEEMREERRRQNDEYQFQTYFKEVLKNGATFHGEWTVYKTSTFQQQNHDDNTEQTSMLASSSLTPPKLIQVGGEVSGRTKSSPTILVTSRGYKEILSNSNDDDDDINSYSSKFAPLSSDMERIRHEQSIYSNDLPIDIDDKDPETKKVSIEIVGTSYWPEQLAPDDFRGHQGIMVCGK
jgi:hypothetical protein